MCSMIMCQAAMPAIKHVILSNSDLDAIQAILRSVFYLISYFDRVWWRTDYDLSTYMLIMANICACFNGNATILLFY
jgi:hypothetical protein